MTPTLTLLLVAGGMTTALARAWYRDRRTLRTVAEIEAAAEKVTNE